MTPGDGFENTNRRGISIIRFKVHMFGTDSSVSFGLASTNCNLGGGDLK